MSLLTPPTTDIFDSPGINLCINDQWWAHISAQIARLTDREAWDGSDEEVTTAINSIFKLLNVGLPTDCGGD